MRDNNFYIAGCWLATNWTVMGHPAQTESYHSRLAMQERIWINIDPIPEMFVVRSNPDRKVQVIVPRTCITRITDITDHIAAMCEMTLGQVICIMIKMCVVVNRFTVTVALINGDATAVAVKQPDDSAISRG